MWGDQNNAGVLVFTFITDYMLAPTFINISGYRFVHIDDLDKLQAAMKQRLSTLSVLGSVMLASEGINVSLAGTAESIAGFRRWLNADKRFAGIWLKETTSEYIPYQRLRVRQRNEIIAFDGQQSEQRQQNRPAAKSISPTQLKSWIDQQKDLTLLDTRNDYEIVSGTFNQSQHVNIKHFRHFKEAVKTAVANGELDTEKPMITYCTGGIRCEKAAPWLLENGFSEVYQLEGGLLNYFQQCGGSHWQGDCFIFDERVELTPEDLQPTGAGLCDYCQLAVPAGTECQCQLGQH